MKELISFCFDGEEKQFIAEINFSTTLTEDKNRFKITFYETFLKLVINFLLDISGILCFQQNITAICIVSDPKTIMENLFSYYYES